MREDQTQRARWGICVFLAVAVLAAFGPGLRCGFVDFDDPDYVTANPNIQHGLNWQSVKWVFTTGHASNWHPLTWLSHIVDFQFYGTSPLGHHLTSVLLHAANAILLFLLLHRLTGATWRSGLVAAIFALHPLRVESVIWISERKDVLSAFWGLLALWSYASYAIRVKSRSPHSGLCYAAALGCFALGLLSKPMVVTLPFVMLLLDYWPLKREFSARIVLEKVPFLVLSAIACVVTFAVQERGGAVASLASVSVAERLANVPVAYVRYLAKLFWPSGLAVFYGTHHWNGWHVGGAILALALVTAFAVWRRQGQPYLAVGWLWFLGMLVPVIGLVQVGHLSLADRYTYLPGIGILIMAVWGLEELARGNVRLKEALVVFGGGAILACAALTVMQIRFWHDSVALYARTSEISNHDPTFTSYLGRVMLNGGDARGALGYLETALRDGARSGDAAFLSEVRDNLGRAFLQMGQAPEAVSNFDQALALQPQSPVIYYDLGRAFLTNRQPDVAAECFQKGIAFSPKDSDLLYVFGEAELEQGHARAARDAWEKALQSRPDWLAAQQQLAWLLATSTDASVRNGVKALALAQAAERESNGQNPATLAVLAAAYAETGGFSQAIAAASRARELALSQGNGALAKALAGQVSQYDKHLPLHETQ